MVIDYTAVGVVGDVGLRMAACAPEVGSASPRSRAKYVYFSLWGGPSVQATSVDAGKAVPSSKSDWTLVVVGPTVPAQQKSSFLAEQNIIGESKTFLISVDLDRAVCTGLQNFLGAAIFPRKFCSRGGVNS